MAIAVDKIICVIEAGPDQLGDAFDAAADQSSGKGYVFFGDPADVLQVAAVVDRIDEGIELSVGMLAFQIPLQIGGLFLLSMKPAPLKP